MSQATAPARPGGATRPERSGRFDKPSAASPADKPEPKILFQDYFRSVGPRTYAAQVKEASNGNHFIVLTEGKRDDKTGDVRKTKLFVFSEDFESFFKMITKTAEFVKAHPVSEDVRRKQEKFWAKKNAKTEAPRSGNERRWQGKDSR